MPQGDLAALAADLRSARSDVRKETKAVVKRGAVNIKRTWKHLVDSLEDDGSAKHADKALNFDEHGAGGFYSAEIGFDKSKRQGPLGNLLEFDPNETRYGEVALDMEEPRFVAEMSKVGKIL